MFPRFIILMTYLGSGMRLPTCRACSLQGPVDGIGVLEHPTCRNLACWLAGGGKAWVFCPGMKGLEGGVSCWVDGHSFLGIVKLYL